MILYSFIIPVYNVEKYLEECLDSLIRQNYKNWEALLVDDGSTDDSAKICDEYVKKDKRIKTFHRNNEGSLMARRFGMGQAQGDYFLFIDSDDLVHNDLLEEMNRIIQTTGSDMVIYRFQRFGRMMKSNSAVVFPEGTIVGEGGLPKENIWKKVVSGNGLYNLCLKVVSRNIVDWGTDYSQVAFMKSSTDAMQSMALLDNAKKIYFSEKILYFYRYNDSGISSTKAKVSDIESIKAHMMTREVFQKKKLHYLQKNGYASKENLEQYYKFIFISKIEQIVSWLSNVENASDKKMILEYALNESALEEGNKYLQQDVFPKRYQKLYKYYLEDRNKFYNVLCIQALCHNVISKISCAIGKIRK